MTGYVLSDIFAAVINPWRMYGCEVNEFCRFQNQNEYEYIYHYISHTLLKFMVDKT